jgi:hypothetical protein
MSKGNPNISELSGKGRKKRSDEFFFFRVTDTLRVTKDSYNLIIAEIYESKDSGRKYQLNKGFLSTMAGIYNSLATDHSVPKKVLDKFIEKTKGIEVSYDNGRLVLDAPDDLVGDEHDVLTDPNAEPEKSK